MTDQDKGIQEMLNLSNVAWKTLANIKLAKEYLVDYRRYQKYSTPSRESYLSLITGKNLEAQITKDYHRIEKGLSLPVPKRPFGADAAARLEMALNNSRIRSSPTRSPFVGYATSALEGLKKHNAGHPIQDELSPTGLTLPKNTVTDAQLAAFFESRRSVRNFKPNVQISDETVKTAVKLAGTAPSVCNRQGSRAYYFTGRGTIDSLLKHQSGNRGFGHTASGLFIITSDMRIFSGSGERNQSLIDGSLFAMSLVYALHGLGVASCMLNWSKGNDASKALRQEACIAPSENIIVLIAVGYSAEDYRVARSPRRSIEEILVVQDESEARN